MFNALPIAIGINTQFSSKNQQEFTKNEIDNGKAKTVAIFFSTVLANLRNFCIPIT